MCHISWGWGLDAERSWTLIWGNLKIIIIFKIRTVSWVVIHEFDLLKRLLFFWGGLVTPLSKCTIDLEAVDWPSPGKLLCIFWLSVLRLELEVDSYLLIWRLSADLGLHCLSRSLIPSLSLILFIEIIEIPVLLNRYFALQNLCLLLLQILSLWLIFLVKFFHTLLFFANLPILILDFVRKRIVQAAFNRN